MGDSIGFLPCGIDEGPPSLMGDSIGYLPCGIEEGPPSLMGDFIAYLPCGIDEGPPSLMGDSNMASARFSFIFSSNSSLPLGCLATVDSAQLLYTSQRLGD